MAKDLPWFKFYSDEWLTGDITLEDFDIQGLFISVCAYYWKQDCSTTMVKLKKRYRNATKFQWDTLIDCGIIKIENDAITIAFLDEQWQERQSDHEKKRIAGKKGADKRWKNQDVNSTPNSSATKTPMAKHGNKDIEVDKDIDKEKNINIREKSKRFIPPTLNEVKQYCDERNNNVDSYKFVDFYTSKNWYVGKNKMKDWRAAVRTWERNSKTNNNYRSKEKDQYTQDIEDLTKKIMEKSK